ncbi:M14 family zinc carboxypeptidase [Mesonia sediminis]|uniref:M14 family zinc carboxypeptidase n=1 Tax=Mesonia sediminis TaxID=1703946 RepID=A0ABW5SB87_9FLAO
MSLEHYNQIKGRYLSYSNICGYLQSLPSEFNVSVIGHSEKNEKIFKVAFGNGPTKILMWSQMHGNESTTTKAVFDLIEKIRKEATTIFFENLCIHIIPVLNPDGLKAYTRVNANQVDLNRDAQQLSQVESQILKDTYTSISPNFCFNLHDQRTIFGTEGFNKPATLSFLAPAFNEAREVNSQRLKAMQIIAGIYKELSEDLPGGIGRYDDTFNLDCIGDTLMYKGIPTVLFEAGHFPNDYARELTRGFVFSALWKGLSLINDNSFKNFTEKNYFAIPKNEKQFFDLVIENLELQSESYKIGIQYEERLMDREIHFIPIIAEIGLKLSRKGLKVICAKQLKLSVLDEKLLKVGEELKYLNGTSGLFSLNLT